jgi:hypothetical protein
MTARFQSSSGKGAKARRDAKWNFFLCPAAFAYFATWSPASGENRDSEKMKNRGNEAKNWLRAKNITFFKGANHVRFARSFAQI